MIRRINKVAVLGSGAMGSALACHLANAGIEILLLDLATTELSVDEQNAGLSIENKDVRNRIANLSLQKALKTNPSPIYHKDFAARITTGNFDDDLSKIAGYDWIIEAIVERLDVKRQMFEKVDNYRKLGTLITTNTSGIPVNLLTKNRSDDFKQHFCGTHFFNPPRYLKLLEIIPANETIDEVIESLQEFGERFLGKTPVVCKDTPAFIANRIGTYSIMYLLHKMPEFGLSVDQVDFLTGRILGRPKSAVFRTGDLVGLDVLAFVAGGLAQGTNDEGNSYFALPQYMQKMIGNNMLGEKTKTGFYKKIKDEQGKSVILSLNLETLEYEPKKNERFAVVGQAKGISGLFDRMNVLLWADDKIGEFYRNIFFAVFDYASKRMGEITDALFKIDAAIEGGFGWDAGIFKTWDALGVSKVIVAMEQDGFEPAKWVYDMVSSGFESFYKIENGIRKYYDPQTKTYITVRGADKTISLSALRQSNTVWKNNDASIIDLGDGVLNLEFHTKMNVLGAGIIEAMNVAVNIAEKDYKALVISNEGEHFSAGADVGLMYLLSSQKRWDELHIAVKTFQNSIMRMRYSSIPVVAAPHGLTLGGGCELCMHCDKVIAHAETYIGLVEMGVGLIPAGGGTKEFALRLSDELKDGDPRIASFQQRFITIGQAKVSTSAHEAFDLGYLRRGTDEVIINRANQLAYAKIAALQLADKGYSRPQPRNDIKVLGAEGCAAVLVGAESFFAGNYINAHQKLIAEKLGFVLSGGDLSQPLSCVSEQYILDLERQAFVELCMTEQTQDLLRRFVSSGNIE